MHIQTTIACIVNRFPAAPACTFNSDSVMDPEMYILHASMSQSLIINDLPYDDEH